MNRTPPVREILSNALMSYSPYSVNKYLNTERLSESEKVSIKKMWLKNDYTRLGLN